MARLLVVACCLFMWACAHSDRDQAWVRNALARRGLPTQHEPNTRALEASLTGALDEDEIVSLALALNPAYRAELTRVDSARADLVDARSLPNPQLTLLGGMGPISSLATLLAPLEALWQLPQRSQMAARTLESVAEGLVQNGLDLARDARLAHAERGLSETRVGVRAELAATWAELARLAEVRGRLGEVSTAEAGMLRAEAGLAADALAVSQRERALARARLRTLLGLSGRAPRFEVTFKRAPRPSPLFPELIALARGARPDLRAAELSTRSAVARLGWERSRVVAFAAQLEGHWTRPDLLAARVGGRIELPIFNANRGGIGRAEAELQRAHALLVATRQRVVLEIVQAQTRAEQALGSLGTYRTDVLPALEDARRVAARNYEAGEEPAMTLLDVMRRLSEARLREAELVADWRRASAELERAVGARIVRQP